MLVRETYENEDDVADTRMEEIGRNAPRRGEELASRPRIIDPDEVTRGESSFDVASRR